MDAGLKPFAPCFFFFACMFSFFSASTCPLDAVLSLMALDQFGAPLIQFWLF
jgi:hypothetical protein